MTTSARCCGLRLFLTSHKNARRPMSLKSRFVLHDRFRREEKDQRIATKRCQEATSKRKRDSEGGT